VCSKRYPGADLLFPLAVAVELSLWQSRFDEYLRARNFSVRSVEGYLGELKPFLAFLDELGLQSLAGLTRSHLEEYRLKLFYRKARGKSLSARTQSQKLSCIRQFVRFLAAYDYLLIDVSAGLEMPRVPNSLPRVILSEPETVRLMEAPDVTTALGIRDRAILEVLYATGLRNSEMGQMVLDQIDWENHCIRVWAGKGAKDRVIPLGEEAEIWLSEYLQRSRPVYLRNPEQKVCFLNTLGKPFTRESLAQVVSRWAKKIGLEKPVTPHTLRHCCASHMLKRGAGLRHIQTMLGHSSPDSTQIYTRVEVSDLRKVILRCHPRERPS
jgi:integrase/recombinase XerD